MFQPKDKEDEAGQGAPAALRPPEGNGEAGGGGKPRPASYLPKGKRKGGGGQASPPPVTFGVPEGEEIAENSATPREGQLSPGPEH